MIGNYIWYAISVTSCTLHEPVCFCIIYYELWGAPIATSNECAEWMQDWGLPYGNQNHQIHSRLRLFRAITLTAKTHTHHSFIPLQRMEIAETIINCKMWESTSHYNALVFIQNSWIQFYLQLEDWNIREILFQLFHLRKIKFLYSKCNK